MDEINIEGVAMKELKKYGDERGWLIETHREDSDNFVPAMSYASFTKFGLVRGPHEHFRQSDFFIFIGPGDFDIRLWDARADSPTYGLEITYVGGASRPMSLLVPPGVVHGYKCITEEGGWVYNSPNKLYKGPNRSEEVDEIRHELNPESPYKL